MDMGAVISASLLSADVLHLAEELGRIKAAGCGHVHFDVMDGVFVNNISYGLPMLAGVRRGTDMPIDVHLMITDPGKYIPAFIKAGADMVSFHTEAAEDPGVLLSLIRQKGVKAGLAVKPSTPLERVLPFLDKADYVLQMTVEPGFGGQAFMQETLPRIREIKKHLTASGRDIPIQVDGGINGETAVLAGKAGAEIFVAGSYLFGSEDMTAAAKLLSDGVSCKEDILL